MTVPHLSVSNLLPGLDTISSQHPFWLTHGDVMRLHPLLEGHAPALKYVAAALNFTVDSTLDDGLDSVATATADCAPGNAAACTLRDAVVAATAAGNAAQAAAAVNVPAGMYDLSYGPITDNAYYGLQVTGAGAGRSVVAAFSSLASPSAAGPSPTYGAVAVNSPTAGGSVSQPYVETSPSSTAGLTDYGIFFATSGSGAMSSPFGGSGKITFTAPAGTTLPSSPCAYQIHDFGSAVSTGFGPTCAGSVNLNAPGNVAVLTASQIGAGDQLEVLVEGVTNPPTASNSERILVQTSSDPTAVASVPYAVTGSAQVSNLSVLNMATMPGAQSEYDISFQTSSTGGGFTSLTLTAPKGTVFPSLLATGGTCENGDSSVSTYGGVNTGAGAPPWAVSSVAFGAARNVVTVNIANNSGTVNNQPFRLCVDVQSPPVASVAEELSVATNTDSHATLSDPYPVIAPTGFSVLGVSAGVPPAPTNRPAGISSVSGLTIETGGLSSVSGAPPRGGGIAVASPSGGPAGSVELTNDVVFDNFADQVGGGIFLQNATGYLNNVTVKGNEALNAGSGVLEGNQSSMQVDNSSVTGNGRSTTDLSGSNPSYGGGLLVAGALSGSSDTISGNLAGVGAGIACFGTLALSNSAIARNGFSFFMSSSTQEVAGGGLFNMGLADLTNVSVDNNFATFGGGILNGLQPNQGQPGFAGNLTVTGGSVSSNTVAPFTPFQSTTPVGGYGGGIITLTGTVSLTGVSVDSNEAVAGGGIIAAVAPLDVSGGSVSHNDSSEVAGGILAIGDNATLTNVAVNDNTSGDGGGIVAAEANTTMTGGSVSSNMGVGCSICAGGQIPFSAGGGILLALGTASLSGVSVDSNTEASPPSASSSGPLGFSAFGGGIASLGGQSVIKGGSLSGNRVLMPGPVTAGFPPTAGGGMFNYALGASLTNVTVSANSAAGGAGIFDEGPLTVSGGSITANIAGSNGLGFGGGLLAEGGADLTGVTVSGNKAAASLEGIGGGIASCGSLHITNSNITANSASLLGGGLIQESGSCTNNSTGGGAVLTGDTISGNSATQDQGGGIYNFAGALSMTNDTITGNSSGGSGAGVFDVGNLQMTNVTISSNSVTSAAPNEAAGLDDESQASLQGVILAGDTVAGRNLECLAPPGNVFTTAGFNLSSDASCNLTGTGDLQKTNPHLGPLAHNGGPTETEAIGVSSPAASADRACLPPATDQRGAPRPSGHCSIGAFQVSGAPVTSITSATHSPVVGQPIAIAVKVAGAFTAPGVPTPSGKVTVSDGHNSCQAALIGSGGVSTGSCSFSEKAAAKYSFTAAYGGDANFPASKTAAATVVTVAKSPSATSLSLSSASITSGTEQTEHFAVVVAPHFGGAPGGSVAIRSGTTTLCAVTLSGGKGSCALKATQLAAGNYNVIAYYGGDANFTLSQSTTHALRVVSPVVRRR